MKYSDLIYIKQILDEHNLDNSSVIVENQLKGMSECIKDKYTGEENKVLRDVLINQYEIVKNGFETLKYIVDKIKLDVAVSLESHRTKLLSLSRKCYKEDIKKSTSKILETHKSQVHYETSRFAPIISKYGSWQHAGLIIHPGRESFIDSMIDNDPLYLVDQSYELLKPAISRFNEVYQRRLRKYIVDEKNKEEILKQLPDNQFGLCVVYHYFNFRTFEIVQRYLEEIHRKLKPGGTLIFTFNDCETFSGVRMVEAGKRCYATKTLVKEELHRIGYELIHMEDFDAIQGIGTWVEVKKHGNLDSIRGSQTLAKIIPK